MCVGGRNEWRWSGGEGEESRTKKRVDGREERKRRERKGDEERMAVLADDDDDDKSCRLSIIA